MTRLITLVFLSMLVAGCERPDPPAPSVADDPALDADLQRLAAAFEGEAEGPRRKLLVSARGFRESIEGLLHDPDEERLETARNAWSALYANWNRARVVIGVGAATDPRLQAALERTDPLPIMPGYVDGLSLWPDSGIVHDVTVVLDRDSLLAQQDVTAEGEASLGFQVIRFLLFGEPDALRPLADLAPAEVAADSDLSGTELPANRRRTYLDAASALLAEDLAQLASHEQAPHGRLLAAVLADTLAEASQRLALVDALEDAGDPAAGDFLDPASREIARSNLEAALAPWFRGEHADALLASWAQIAPAFARLFDEPAENHAALAELLKGRPAPLRRQ